MSEYHIWLFIAAFAASISCIVFNKPRGLLWIGAGAGAFVASVVYLYSGLPHAPSVALMCDAAVCIAIYFRYTQTWEKLVYACFLLMAGTNLIYQASLLGIGWHIDPDIYATVLEIFNFLALAIIGGTPALKKARDYVSGNPGVGGLIRYLARAGFALSQNRTKPPFTTFP